jgi:hypothetical protein
LSIGDGLALGRAARYISAASRHPVPMGAQQGERGVLMARQFLGGQLSPAISNIRPQ